MQARFGIADIARHLRHHTSSELSEIGHTALHKLRFEDSSFYNLSRQTNDGAGSEE